MKLPLYFLSLLGFFLKGCTHYPPDPGSIAYREAVISCSKKLTIPTEVSGIRANFNMHGVITKLRADYFFDKQVSKDEARQVSVAIIDSFMKEMNQKTDLKQYLHHSPILPEDVELSIEFFYPENLNVEGSVLYVLFINGKLYFSERNRETGFLKDIHQETYTAAQEIVRTQDPLPVLVTPKSEVCQLFNVDELLQRSGKTWKEVVKMDDGDTVMICYAPSDCSEEDMRKNNIKEVFSIKIQKNDSEYGETIQERYDEIMEVFPGGKKKARILHADAHSILAEWNLSANKEFSWVKFLKKDDTLITLQYTVQDKSNLIKLGRQVWLPILKQAN